MTGEVRVHFTSRRFHETEAFYTGVLLLPVLERHDGPQDRGVVFPLGAVLLEVFEESVRHPFEELRGVHLSAEVDDIDAWYERLAREGAVAPATGPRDRPWGHRAFTVQDPNGLPITLYSQLKVNPVRQDPSEGR